MEQIIFIITLIVTIAIFAYSISKIVKNFKMTNPAYPIRDFKKRFLLLLKNGFGQERIFRNRIAGILHALVFWGFCVILFGSIEMVIDGVTGTEKSLARLGFIYDFLMASGDIFAYVISVCIIVFIIRRCCLNISRLHGKELLKSNHIDAFVALSLILILMITLIGMNVFYVLLSSNNYYGVYPISAFIAKYTKNINYETLETMYGISWWSHILLIFFFANILPYSKHFHIFMSLPNVFLSRITPLGKLPNMDNITTEVKVMLNIAQPDENNNAVPARFGILDVEDITWKNYIDSLSCTECGRCTSVCPASITGKALSPRKLIMDIRKRMKEKSPYMRKYGKNYNDGKTLIRNYISEEEIWACTTCNACAKECPLNIDHPTFIVDLRRYLVMEEAKAPAPLNSMFSFIENNGAPWQYSGEDRLQWVNN